MTDRTQEKYSSAFTLSDMEIFIFPELLYSLVLANILSPEIWKWRDDKWFRKIETLPPLKRIQRVKQYIMDHYDFNLDLETWGLTDKETEINRFREFIDPEVLRQSNALFGYEGDRYYFDIDIRRHFGLDKYDTDIIPYWKTETVEAMNAFRFKPGHPVGAGECVSLATLYAAALFIVAGIPLEQIFLMGTPLHSQNYILVEDGVLTNNRRIVTKSMWYNGTELSALARRALEHEQITIVAHQTGYIHSVYPEATIDQEAYRRFRESLTSFLNIGMDYEIFINFLRSYHRYQKLFQLVVHCRGSVKYLPLDKAFGYEHGSKNRLGDKTARKLLCEIGDEDFCYCPFEDRATINDKDPLFQLKPYPDFIHELMSLFPDLDPNQELRKDLRHFVHTVPKLPGGEKRYAGAQGTEHRAQGTEAQGHRGTERRACEDGVLGITTAMTREEIMDALLRVEGRGSRVKVKDPASSIQLAFYAGRFMDYCDWTPFLKAALERNPVSVSYFRESDLQEVFAQMSAWPDESIYEGNRLALPDEVVNFGRGDGIEKAITLSNVIKARSRGETIMLRIDGREVHLQASGGKYHFTSEKHFKKNLTL
ncbi:MAG: hypothetical protein D4R67_04705 [Bacteroidetes bacterium]|nr:MAG: hypothetical protein D4R67_04705 [Bacteroidota bacterium]